MAAPEQREKEQHKRDSSKSGKVTVYHHKQHLNQNQNKALKKQADKLLATKKKKTADPNYKPQKASGMTRDERHRLRNAARRLMSDMRKGKEKPASPMTHKLRTLENKLVQVHIQILV